MVRTVKSVKCPSSKVGCGQPNLLCLLWGEVTEDVVCKLQVLGCSCKDFQHPNFDNFEEKFTILLQFLVLVLQVVFKGKNYYKIFYLSSSSAWIIFWQNIIYTKYITSDNELTACHWENYFTVATLQMVYVLCVYNKKEKSQRITVSDFYLKWSAQRCNFPILLLLSRRYVYHILILACDRSVNVWNIVG